MHRASRAVAPQGTAAPTIGCGQLGAQGLPSGCAAGDCGPYHWMWTTRCGSPLPPARNNDNDENERKTKMVQRLLNDVYVVDEARQLALRERGYGPPPVTSAAGGRSQRSAARQNRGDRERGRGGVRTAVPMGTVLAGSCFPLSQPFLLLFGPRSPPIGTVCPGVSPYCTHFREKPPCQRTRRII